MSRLTWWLVGVVPADVAADRLADVEHTRPDGTKLVAFAAGTDAAALLATLRRARPWRLPGRPGTWDFGPALRLPSGALVGSGASLVQVRGLRAGRAWPLSSRRLVAALRRYDAAPSTPADDAFTALEHLAWSLPRDPELWGRLTVQLNNRHDAPAAIRAGRRAVRNAEGRDRRVALRRLADACVEAGRFAAAERIARRLVERALAEDDADEGVRCTYTLGNALRNLGRLTDAEPRFAEVARGAATRGPAFTLLRIRASRMQLWTLARMGRYADAERIGAANAIPAPSEPMLAVGTLPVSLDPPTLPRPQVIEHINLYATWAEAALESGRAEDAERRYRAMYDLATRHQLRSHAMRARFGLAWATLRLGQLDIATAWCRFKPGQFEEGNEGFVAPLRYLQGEVALARGDLAPAAACAAEVREALEAGRAGASGLPGRSPHLEWCCLSLEARIAARRGEVEQALVLAQEGIAVVERTLADVGGPLACPQFLDDKVPLYGTAVEAAAALGRWDEALLAAEAAATRAIRERVNGAGVLPAPTLADVQVGLGALQGAGCAAVTLFAGPTDLLIFDHTGGRHERLVGMSARMRGLVSQVEAALHRGGPVPELLWAAAAQLEPLTRLVGESTAPLVLFPHGWLRSLPWDLLPVGDGTLAERRPVATGLSLSTTTTCALSERRRRSLLLAPTVLTADLLRGAVATLRPGLVQFAGKTDLLDAMGDAWTLLVAHGAPRALQLADGELPTSTLLEERWGGGIVLLASCSTAAVPNGTTDPLDIVAPALIACGSDAVVAPTVPVPAAGALQFLTTLASRLDRGEPLGDAFRAARLATVDTPGTAAFQVLVRNVGALHSALPPPDIRR